MLPDKDVVWEEDQEPTLVSYKEFARYTSNGASFRYNEDLGDWEMSAGGGGGGGSVSAMRLTPLSPLNIIHVPGQPLTLSFNYAHSSINTQR